MEENKTIFDTVKLDTNEVRAAAEQQRELEIFGEADQPKKGGGKGAGILVKLVFVLLGVLIGVVLSLLLVSKRVGGLDNLDRIRNMGEYDTSVITDLLHGIDQYHFGETPTSKELIEKSAHALVDAMGDPYAAYFTKEEYEDYRSSFNGNYYGIGITITAPDGTGARIHRVYEGSFAEEAGLKSGDLVIKVNGVDVRSKTSDELVSLIKGEEGTTVDITFLRGDEEITTTVKRGEVYVKRVDRFMLDGDIGYLYLNSFTGNALEEFKEALKYFEDNGAKSMIVDLRDDPGGSLYTVVDICDLLLPECTIVSMQGKTTDPTEYYKSDKEMNDIPFVVLVNEYSASASEIFAGAMQDNNRAKIIGTKTYGKGVVQTTITLNGDNGYLKMTTDAYYTPNGTNLGGTGITPDIEVELPEEYFGLDIYTLVTEYAEHDAQLSAAIDELTK